MIDDLPLPPFDSDGKNFITDTNFLAECQNALDVMLANEPDILTLQPRVSISKEFGPVFRVDFTTPNDEIGAVNRIMLWKLPDGKLAEFFGLDIPALPLE